MKTNLQLCLSFAFAILLVKGAAQITTPRTPSPAASVTQRIGISDVTINYSRPSVRDRDIWGSLVPYGWNVQGFGLGNSAPWRSGANENTTISLTHDAEIQGKGVPAGTYGLFFIINEDNTGEVILSKDTQSWGSFFYDPANDVIRADIKIRDVYSHTVTLTYSFIYLDKNSGELVLDWEKKQFPVKIAFAVDEIVMANATEELKGTTGFNFLGPSSAANYAMNNGIALEKGLVWIDQAIAQSPTFNNKRVKVGILTQLNRNDEAEKIIAGAIDTATEPELNIYGYQLAGQQKFDEAIRIFTLNTERFPESANAWDSLGEGHFLAGNEKEAIKCFKKSLSMNPPANVKANSEKYLKQLGAMK